MNSLLLDFLTFFSVLSAILVITARSPVLAVIFLIAVFINLAGYLILLGINFIGLAYIMVYIGAIAILFLFVIMMLNIRLVELSEVGSEYNKNVPLAVIIASALSYLILSNTISSKFDQIYLITALFDKVNFWLTGITSSENSIYVGFNTIYNNIFVNYDEVQVIGAMLYSSHGLYLVLVSFILLLAMIGPIIMTLDKKSSNSPPQDISVNNSNQVKKSFNSTLFNIILLFIIFYLVEELIQTILLSQFNEMLFSICVPVMIYHNVDLDKLQILKNNKGKAGTYLFTNIQTGKSYVGSSYNLSERLRLYFSLDYLEKKTNMHINRALLLHGYSSFSLSILDYIEIDKLSKDQAKAKILECEQFYIDTLNPRYNINPIAGSRLGSQHSDKTIALMSESKKGKYSGENNPFFGKTHSSEVRLKLSEIKKNKKGENSPRYGKLNSEETKALRAKKVFVYSNDSPSIILLEFSSYTNACLHFNCNRQTIANNIDTKKLFNGKWLLSSKLII